MLVYLIAGWFLFSAADDLMILLAWLGSLFDRDEALREPREEELAAAITRRIAIFVPAWREHSVIGRMLEQNLATLRYESYVILVGTYPNDPMTQEAVRSVAARDGRVRLVVGPRPGPTSKADCMNALYRHLAEIEEREGRFELVMIHDAEDVLHPDELRMKSWWAARFDMVQTPVLPFATGWREMTHGLYCDDFAEFHTKDMRARNWLGGFVPSCGVATAFRRADLEVLAGQNASGEPFEPGCLTEDYELGYRLQKLGARQVFVPLRPVQGSVRATREYFPRAWKAAVRQRSRWITGIVFQGWRNHGWGSGPFDAYWFWRDRKGVVGCPMSLAANGAFAGHVLLGWSVPALSAAPAGMVFAILVLTVVNATVRAWCTGRIYGWRFALLAPVRQVWGNFINTLAIGMAMHTVAQSVRTGSGLVWKKTEHVLPGVGNAGQARPLAELLIAKGWMREEELRRLAARRKPGLSLGEYLWRTGRLSPGQVQALRNEQQGVDIRVAEYAQPARLLPAHVVERWRVVPIGLGPGEIRVAAVDLPRPGLDEELRKHTNLRPRVIFVTPAQFGALRSQFHRLTDESGVETGSR